MKEGSIEYTKDFKTRKIIFPITHLDAVMNEKDETATYLFGTKVTAITLNGTDIPKDDNKVVNIEIPIATSEDIQELFK